MQLKTIVVGPFEVNCYLYWDEHSLDAVIVDPGGDSRLILDAVAQAGAHPQGILLTHGHGDHIAAVATVKSELDIPLYANRADLDLLSRPSDVVSTFYGETVTSPPPDVFVQDEQLLACGSFALRVLATPGHTPGGVCYLDERQGVLFCGDTLFSGGIGRTDLPGGDHSQLIDSIQNRILSLPDSVVCYPGHGPSTTVGAERSSNPFFTGGYAV